MVATVRQLDAKNAETVQGIDVSYYQGDIDWTEVRDAGFQFAFIRTSDSLTKPDPMFFTNWTKAGEVGIVRGPYIYFRPSQSAIEQAEDMLRRVDLAGGLDTTDLPPVLDIETTSGMTQRQVLAKAQAFIKLIEQKAIRTPIVYSYPYFLNAYSKDLCGYPLWIADYDRQPPRVPEHWQQWRFWQTSRKGKVPGIRGNVDLNVFDGSESQLATFIVKTHLPDKAYRRLKVNIALRYLRLIGR